ncbi:MAG: DUF72 domain-containing protein [Acidimicrobiales bacterium]
MEREPNPAEVAPVALPWPGVDRPGGGRPGPAVRLGTSVVRAGTCSWADRALVASGRFYPRRTMSAAERLAWYGGRLPLAELTTTYRYPPTPEVCAQWAARAPDGLVFDVRAWSLLGGNPTFPDSLWPDLQDQVLPACRPRRRLYPGHLPSAALDECWARFAGAVAPLRRAGRLGAVIIQYPGWFSPRPEAWAELERAARRLPGQHVAVELGNPRWWEGDACETTLEFLEHRDLAVVCHDGPGTGPGTSVVAATTDLAVVRFVGRPAPGEDRWTTPYRYTGEELEGWVPRIVDLASSASEVHLLVDTGPGPGAVEAATTLLGLVEAEGKGPPRRGAPGPGARPGPRQGPSGAPSTSAEATTEP